MLLYRRVQWGRFLLWIFGAAWLLQLGVLLAAARGTGEPSGFWSSLEVTGLILGAAFLAFGRMEVRVEDRVLRVSQAFGLLRRRVPLETIRDVRPGRIPWYLLGIKFHRGGWWWSVAPGEALEPTLEGGKLLVVGTEDPRNLAAALGVSVLSGRA